MTDADRHSDIAVDDLKAGIARDRRNTFLVNMAGVAIAVAAVVVAGYYSLGEVDEAERQVAVVAEARDEAERQVAVVAEARDEAERQVAVVAEARDEARMAADEANRKFAEAQNAAQTAQATAEETEAQRSQLATTVAELQSSAENARGEFDAVVAERESISSELAQTRQAFEATKTERSELAATVSVLQSRDVETRGKYESVVVERDKLNRQAAALRSTANARLQSLQTASDRLLQAERANKSLDRRFVALSTDAGKASAQVKTLEKQISRLQVQNQRLKQQLAAAGFGKNGGDFACARAIQNKIAWDYSGLKLWDADSIKRLCGSQTRSTEPARCFQTVMFGGVNWGRGTQWKRQDAIDLCEGASKASARIDCFKRALPRLRSQRAAIAACDERSARTR